MMMNSCRASCQSVKHIGELPLASRSCDRMCIASRGVMPPDQDLRYWRGDWMLVIQTCQIIFRLIRGSSMPLPSRFLASLPMLQHDSCRRINIFLCFLQCIRLILLCAVHQPATIAKCNQFFTEHLLCKALYPC